MQKNKINLNEKLQEKIVLTVMAAMADYQSYSIKDKKEHVQFNESIEALLSMLNPEFKELAFHRMIDNYEPNMKLDSLDNYIKSVKYLQITDSYEFKDFPLSVPTFIYLYQRNKEFFKEYMSNNTVDLKETCNYPNEQLKICRRNILDFICDKAAAHFYEVKLEEIISPLTKQDIKKIKFLNEKGLSLQIQPADLFMDLNLDYCLNQEKFYEELLEKNYPLIGGSILLSLLGNYLQSGSSISSKQVRQYKDKYLNIFSERDKEKMLQIYCECIKDHFLYSVDKLNLDNINYEIEKSLKILDIFSYHEAEENKKVLFSQFKSITKKEWESAMRASVSEKITAKAEKIMLYFNLQENKIIKSKGVLKV